MPVTLIHFAIHGKAHNSSSLFHSSHPLNCRLSPAPSFSPQTAVVTPILHPQLFIPSLSNTSHHPHCTQTLHYFIHSFIHPLHCHSFTPSPHSFITSSPHTLTSIHSCTLPLSRPLAPEELQRVNTPTNTETPLLSIRTRASLNIRR